MARLSKQWIRSTGTFNIAPTSGQQTVQLPKAIGHTRSVLHTKVWFTWRHSTSDSLYIAARTAMYGVAVRNSIPNVDSPNNGPDAWLMWGQFSCFLWPQIVTDNFGSVFAGAGQHTDESSAQRRTDLDGSEAYLALQVNGPMFVDEDVSVDWAVSQLWAASPP